jgi:hypothetical protein
VATKDPLLAEISALLADPADSDDPDRLERTLTDGYARALLLEAQHRRFERQGELTDARQAGEELGALRAKLLLLRRRHSSAVRAAAAALHEA